ncbi:MAG: AMP-binding protein, partial [Parvularculaceae bacterium]|nr:AMP-binding protein [Parvularculaceae bacterium]
MNAPFRPRLVNPEYVADMIAEQARRDPERTALVFEGATISYAALEERARKAANALIGLGLKRGDRLVWLARNLGVFWETFFGAAKIGVVMTPVNWRLAPGEVALIIEDARPALIVGERMFLEPLREAQPNPPAPVMTLEQDDAKSFERRLALAPSTAPTHRPALDDA